MATIFTIRNVQMKASGPRGQQLLPGPSHRPGHIRTVSIPVWVKEAIDCWTQASGITDGRIFRPINKAGKIWGDGMTPKVIWEIVKQAVKAAGIEKLGPHDLRRT
jgi:integrase